MHVDQIISYVSDRKQYLRRRDGRAYLTDIRCAVLATLQHNPFYSIPYFKKQHVDKYWGICTVEDYYLWLDELHRTGKSMDIHPVPLATVTNTPAPGGDMITGAVATSLSVSRMEMVMTTTPRFTRLPFTGYAHAVTPSHPVTPRHNSHGDTPISKAVKELTPLQAYLVYVILRCGSHAEQEVMEDHIRSVCVLECSILYLENGATAWFECIGEQ